MWITKFASCLLSLLPTALAAVAYGGVNEGGGSLAPEILPGEFGVTYEFINYTNTQYFLDNGVNIFRITLLLERMCPPATGLGRTFKETYYDEFIDAVNFITNGGGHVIIDPHNYMRYNGSVIGNSSDPHAATTDQFAEFWHEIAKRTRFNPRVVYGIMNEPHDMPTELVFKNDQAAINAIRYAGARQLILEPGNGWTGASDWTQPSCEGCTPNSEVLTKIRDPGHNIAFDMHQYFDIDGSGTHDTCVSTTIGTERLYNATQWLKQNGYEAFLSEFGAGSNQLCFDCVNNVLDFLDENDEWIGWSYWAAGPMWGDYFQSIEPYQGPEFTTTWPNCLKPHLP
ncbi:glycoside hydrolase [Lipomyces tetrasporus]|uniref:cellulase n=1 Tax=Lipomyces tetrasporus TaxID=54092 RepID=A0AAD7QK33_9ASCO|nr:glycoside hydrolase [Lipomyces tetrasporus]KAJ8096679.1 glycoside hydrolase [Lipomyces tetrasporus]